MMTTKKRRQSIRSLVVIAAFSTLLTACGPPGQREARHGRKLVLAGQFTDAIAPLKEAARILAAAPRPSQSKVWNLLGLAYHGARQFGPASDAYARALKLDRNNVAADYNLGCLRLDQGDTQGAIDYLNTFVMLRPRDVNGYLRLATAQCHLALEKTGAQRNTLMESARHNFESAGKLDATAPSLNGFGVIELYRKTPAADSIKTAGDYFQQAMRRDPHFAPALLNLAILQQRYLNEPSQALQNYRKYLELGPAMPHAKEVEKILQQLDLQTKISITPQVRANPANPPAQIVVHPTNPLPAPSKPQAPAVEVTPTKPPPAVSVPPPPPQNLVASVPAPVAPEISPDPAHSESPALTTPSQNNLMPEVEVAAPQPTPPRKTFAQKINPLHWFSAQSKTTATSGGATPATDPPLVPKGARYSYPLRVTLIPGKRPQAVRWMEAGTQARQKGLLSEALHDYQQAVEADPTYYEANEALGLAALDCRDYTMALETLNRALMLRSDSANARYAFAWTLQKRGYYEDAAEELDKLLAAHPDEVRGHLLLGKLEAEKLNQPKLAREHYVRALDLDPQSPQAAAIRSWIGQNR
jgi:tetratricopeptide (TPR) repeat protein